MAERAKIFTYGGSQAIRLPKAVQFPEALRDVVVWREGRRVILEPADEWTSDFIEALGSWNEDIERSAKRTISLKKDRRITGN
jgi:antitoxin VapB